LRLCYYKKHVENRGLYLLIDVNCILQPIASIAHDVRIGSHSVVSSYAMIAGNVIIGNNTYIAFHTGIKQGISIGSNTIIGMGAMVHKDIPDCVIAMGSPARVFKENIDQKVFK
jgi:UDP-3-O-[3-hydroxymyristoyl] glucosamine N-acyltransferase